VNVRISFYDDNAEEQTAAVVIDTAKDLLIALQTLTSVGYVVSKVESANA
jgi:hypothetical protein